MAQRDIRLNGHGRLSDSVKKPEDHSTPKTVGGIRNSFLKIAQGEKTHENVRRLSTHLNNYITQWKNNGKWSEGLLKFTRRKLLFIHFYCCNVAQLTNTYLLDDSMKQALLSYVLLEGKALSKPENGDNNEIKSLLEVRMVRLLWSIYSKYYFYLTGRIDRIGIWKIIYRFLESELPANSPDFFPKLMGEIRKILLSAHESSILPYYTGVWDYPKKVVDSCTSRDSQTDQTSDRGSKSIGIDCFDSDESDEDELEELRGRLKELQSRKPVERVEPSPANGARRLITTTNLKANTLIYISDESEDDEPKKAKSKHEIYKPPKVVIDLTNDDDDDDDSDENSTSEEAMRQRLMKQARSLLSELEMLTGTSEVSIKMKNGNVEIDPIKNLKENDLARYYEQTYRNYLDLVLVPEDDETVDAFSSIENSYNHQENGRSTFRDFFPVSSPLGLFQSEPQKLCFDDKNYSSVFLQYEREHSSRINSPLTVVIWPERRTSTINEISALLEAMQLSDRNQMQKPVIADNRAFAQNKLVVKSTSAPQILPVDFSAARGSPSASSPKIVDLAKKPINNFSLLHNDNPFEKTCVSFSKISFTTSSSSSNAPSARRNLPDQGSAKSITRVLENTSNVPLYNSLVQEQSNIDKPTSIRFSYGSINSLVTEDVKRKSECVKTRTGFIEFATTIMQATSQAISELDKSISNKVASGNTSQVILECTNPSSQYSGFPVQGSTNVCEAVDFSVPASALQGPEFIESCKDNELHRLKSSIVPKNIVNMSTNYCNFFAEDNSKRNKDVSVRASEQSLSSCENVPLQTNLLHNIDIDSRVGKDVRNGPKCLQQQQQQQRIIKFTDTTISRDHLEQKEDNITCKDNLQAIEEPANAKLFNTSVDGSTHTDLPPETITPISPEVGSSSSDSFSHYSEELRQYSQKNISAVDPTDNGPSSKNNSQIGAESIATNLPQEVADSNMLVSQDDSVKEPTSYEDESHGTNIVKPPSETCLSVSSNKEGHNTIEDSSGFTVINKSWEDNSPINAKLSGRNAANESQLMFELENRGISSLQESQTTTTLNFLDSSENISASEFDKQRKDPVDEEALLEGVDYHGPYQEIDEDTLLKDEHEKLEFMEPGNQGSIPEESTEIVGVSTSDTVTDKDNIIKADEAKPFYQPEQSPSTTSNKRVLILSDVIIKPADDDSPSKANTADVSSNPNSSVEEQKENGCFLWCPVEEVAEKSTDSVNVQSYEDPLSDATSLVHPSEPSESKQDSVRSRRNSEEFVRSSTSSVVDVEGCLRTLEEDEMLQYNPGFVVCTPNQLRILQEGRSKELPDPREDIQIVNNNSEGADGTVLNLSSNSNVSQLSDAHYVSESQANDPLDPVVERLSNEDTTNILLDSVVCSVHLSAMINDKIQHPIGALHRKEHSGESQLNEKPIEHGTIEPTKVPNSYLQGPHTCPDNKLMELAGIALEYEKAVESNDPVPLDGSETFNSSDSESTLKVAEPCSSPESVDVWKGAGNDAAIAKRTIKKRRPSIQPGSKRQRTKAERKCMDMLEQSQIYSDDDTPLAYRLERCSSLDEDMPDTRDTTKSQRNKRTDESLHKGGSRSAVKGGKPLGRRRLKSGPEDKTTAPSEPTYTLKLRSRSQSTSEKEKEETIITVAAAKPRKLSNNNNKDTNKISKTEKWKKRECNGPIEQVLHVDAETPSNIAVPDDPVYKPMSIPIPIPTPTPSRDTFAASPPKKRYFLLAEKKQPFLEDTTKRLQNKIFENHGNSAQAGIVLTPVGGAQEIPTEIAANENDSVLQKCNEDISDDVSLDNLPLSQLRRSVLSENVPVACEEAIVVPQQMTALAADSTDDNTKNTLLLGKATVTLDNNYCQDMSEADIRREPNNQGNLCTEGDVMEVAVELCADIASNSQLTPEKKSEDSVNATVASECTIESSIDANCETNEEKAQRQAETKINAYSTSETRLQKLDDSGNVHTGQFAKLKYDSASEEYLHRRKQRSSFEANDAKCVPTWSNSSKDHKNKKSSGVKKKCEEFSRKETPEFQEAAEKGVIETIVQNIVLEKATAKDSLISEAEIGAESFLDDKLVESNSDRNLCTERLFGEAPTKESATELQQTVDTTTSSGNTNMDSNSQLIPDTNSEYSEYITNDENVHTHAETKINDLHVDAVATSKANSESHLQNLDDADNVDAKFDPPQNGSEPEISIEPKCVNKRRKKGSSRVESKHSSFEAKNSEQIIVEPPIKCDSSSKDQRKSRKKTSDTGKKYVVNDTDDEFQGTTKQKGTETPLETIAEDLQEKVTTTRDNSKDSLSSEVEIKADNKPLESSSEGNLCSVATPDTTKDNSTSCYVTNIDSNSQITSEIKPEHSENVTVPSETSVKGTCENIDEIAHTLEETKSSALHVGAVATCSNSEGGDSQNVDAKLDTSQNGSESEIAIQPKCVNKRRKKAPSRVESKHSLFEAKNSENIVETPSQNHRKSIDTRKKYGESSHKEKAYDSEFQGTTKKKGAETTLQNIADDLQWDNSGAERPLDNKHVESTISQENSCTEKPSIVEAPTKEFGTDIRTMDSTSNIIDSNTELESKDSENLTFANDIHVEQIATDSNSETRLQNVDDSVNVNTGQFAKLDISQNDSESEISIKPKDLNKRRKKESLPVESTHSSFDAKNSENIIVEPPTKKDRKSSKKSSDTKKKDGQISRKEKAYDSDFHGTTKKEGTETTLQNAAEDLTEKATTTGAERLLDTKHVEENAIVESPTEEFATDLRTMDSTSKNIESNSQINTEMESKDSENLTFASESGENAETKVNDIHVEPIIAADSNSETRLQNLDDSGNARGNVSTDQFAKHESEIELKPKCLNRRRTKGPSPAECFEAKNAQHIVEPQTPSDSSTKDHRKSCRKEGTSRKKSVPTDKNASLNNIVADLMVKATATTWANYSKNTLTSEAELEPLLNKSVESNSRALTKLISEIPVRESGNLTVVPKHLNGSNNCQRNEEDFQVESIITDYSKSKDAACIEPEVSENTSTPDDDLIEVPIDSQMINIPTDKESVLMQEGVGAVSRNNGKQLGTNTVLGTLQFENYCSDGRILIDPTTIGEPGVSEDLPTISEYSNKASEPIKSEDIDLNSIAASSGIISEVKPQFPEENTADGSVGIMGAANILRDEDVDKSTPPENMEVNLIGANDAHPKTTNISEICQLSIDRIEENEGAVVPAKDTANLEFENSSKINLENSESRTEEISEVLPASTDLSALNETNSSPAVIPKDNNNSNNSSELLVRNEGSATVKIVDSDIADLITAMGADSKIEIIREDCPEVVTENSTFVPDYSSQAHTTTESHEVDSRDILTSESINNIIDNSAADLIAENYGNFKPKVTLEPRDNAICSTLSASMEQGNFATDSEIQLANNVDVFAPAFDLNKSDMEKEKSIMLENNDDQENLACVSGTYAENPHEAEGHVEQISNASYSEDEKFDSDFPELCGFVCEVEDVHSETNSDEYAAVYGGLYETLNIANTGGENVETTTTNEDMGAGNDIAHAPPADNAVASSNSGLDANDGSITEFKELLPPNASGNELGQINDMKGTALAVNEKHSKKEKIELDSAALCDSLCESLNKSVVKDEKIKSADEKSNLIKDDYKTRPESNVPNEDVIIETSSQNVDVNFSASADVSQPDSDSEIEIKPKYLNRKRKKRRLSPVESKRPSHEEKGSHYYVVESQTSDSFSKDHRKTNKRSGESRKDDKQISPKEKTSLNSDDRGRSRRKSLYTNKEKPKEHNETAKQTSDSGTKRTESGSGTRRKQSEKARDKPQKDSTKGRKKSDEEITKIERSDSLGEILDTTEYRTSAKTVRAKKTNRSNLKDNLHEVEKVGRGRPPFYEKVKNDETSKETSKQIKKVLDSTDNHSLEVTSSDKFRYDLQADKTKRSEAELKRGERSSSNQKDKLNKMHDQSDKHEKPEGNKRGGKSDRSRTRGYERRASRSGQTNHVSSSYDRYLSRKNSNLRDEDLKRSSSGNSIKVEKRSEDLNIKTIQRNKESTSKITKLNALDNNTSALSALIDDRRSLRSTDQEPMVNYCEVASLKPNNLIAVANKNNVQIEETQRGDIGSSKNTQSVLRNKEVDPKMKKHNTNDKPFTENCQSTLTGLIDEPIRLLRSTGVKKTVKSEPLNSGEVAAALKPPSGSVTMVDKNATQKEKSKNKEERTQEYNYKIKKYNTIEELFKYNIKLTPAIDNNRRSLRSVGQKAVKTESLNDYDEVVTPVKVSIIGATDKNNVQMGNFKATIKTEDIVRSKKPKENLKNKERIKKYNDIEKLFTENGNLTITPLIAADPASLRSRGQKTVNPIEVASLEPSGLVAKADKNLFQTEKVKTSDTTSRKNTEPVIKSKEELTQIKKCNTIKRIFTLHSKSAVTPLTDDRRPSRLTCQSPMKTDSLSDPSAVTNKMDTNKAIIEAEASTSNRKTPAILKNKTERTLYVMLNNHMDSTKSNKRKRKPPEHKELIKPKESKMKHSGSDIGCGSPSAKRKNNAYSSQDAKRICVEPLHFPPEDSSFAPTYIKENDLSRPIVTEANSLPVMDNQHNIPLINPENSTNITNALLLNPEECKGHISTGSVPTKSVPDQQQQQYEMDFDFFGITETVVGTTQQHNMFDFAFDNVVTQFNPSMFQENTSDCITVSSAATSLSQASPYQSIAMSSSQDLQDFASEFVDHSYGLETVKNFQKNIQGSPINTAMTQKTTGSSISNHNNSSIMLDPDGVVEYTSRAVDSSCYSPIEASQKSPFSPMNPSENLVEGNPINNSTTLQEFGENPDMNATMDSMISGTLVSETELVPRTLDPNDISGSLEADVLDDNWQQSLELLYLQSNNSKHEPTFTDIKSLDIIDDADVTSGDSESDLSGSSAMSAIDPELLEKPISPIQIKKLINQVGLEKVQRSQKSKICPPSRKNDFKPTSSREQSVRVKPVQALLIQGNEEIRKSARVRVATTSLFEEGKGPGINTFPVGENKSDGFTSIRNNANTNIPSPQNRDLKSPVRLDTRTATKAYQEWKQKETETPPIIDPFDQVKNEPTNPQFENRSRNVNNSKKGKETNSTKKGKQGKSGDTTYEPYKTNQQQHFDDNSDDICWPPPGNSPKSRGGKSKSDPYESGGFKEIHKEFVKSARSHPHFSSETTHEDELGSKTNLEGHNNKGESETSLDEKETDDSNQHDWRTKFSKEAEQRGIKDSLFLRGTNCGT